MVGAPYNYLYGEVPPERGTFFRLQVYKRVGISLLEVFERVWKSVISLGKMRKRANRSIYGCENVEKTFCIFFYNSYLKYSVFTAVKRDTTFLTGYVNGLPLILSVDGILKGYLFCQKWYVKGG